MLKFLHSSEIRGNETKEINYLSLNLDVISWKLETCEC